MEGRRRGIPSPSLRHNIFFYSDHLQLGTSDPVFFYMAFVGSRRASLMGRAILEDEEDCNVKELAMGVLGVF